MLTQLDTTRLLIAERSENIAHELDSSLRDAGISTRLQVSDDLTHILDQIVNGETDIALPPEEFRELVSGIQTRLNECAQNGVVASVATSSRRRRFIQTVLSSKGIRNAVLAYEEIGHKSHPKIMGVV